METQVTGYVMKDINTGKYAECYEISSHAPYKVFKGTLCDNIDEASFYQWPKQFAQIRYKNPNDFSDCNFLPVKVVYKRTIVIIEHDWNSD